MRKGKEEVHSRDCHCARISPLLIVKKLLVFQDAKKEAARFPGPHLKQNSTSNRKLNCTDTMAELGTGRNSGELGKKGRGMPGPS
jgi:hypothetical protein